MDAELVPIGEAKARLCELVRASDAREIVLLRHGHPVAVMISYERYGDLIEREQDLLDRLAVHERDEMTMDFDKLSADLELNAS